jgi:hypothetical protein
MDNRDALTTLGPQDTGWRKQKPQHRKLKRWATRTFCTSPKSEGEPRCSRRVSSKWTECGYHWMAVWSLHAIVNVPNQDLLCHCHNCSTCPPGTTPLVGICIAIYNIAIYTFKWIIGVLATIQTICCWFIRL